MKLLIATKNKGKLVEIRKILADAKDLELLSLADLPNAPDIDENGATFAENARIKAKEAAEFSGLLTLADDSGLMVDALDGEPGVHSARYAGEGATDDQRIEKLLAALEGKNADQRSAHFHCAISLYDPKKKTFIADVEGRCDGRILEAKEGKGGFGYDPIFYVEAIARTFASADPKEKNELSHRGLALKKIAPILKEEVFKRCSNLS